MAAIVSETVFTKTAKGILEARNKSAKLPKELGAVFQAIDGKATVGEIQPRLGVATPQLHHALNTLVSDGYIKVVASSTQSAAAPASAPDAVDFTGGPGLSHLNMEAASHALAEAEATKHAQQEARTVLDAKLRAEAEGRARALAETRMQAEAEARAKAEAAARAAQAERAEAEREAATATDPAVRAGAEARARASAGAAVRAEAEARARSEAEGRARALVEEKKAAEARAREEIHAHEKDQEEARARADSEVRARQAVEAKMQVMANPHAQATTASASADTDALQFEERSESLPLPTVDSVAVPPATTRAPAQANTQTWTAEPDFSDLAQRLTARVNAERRARDEADRKHRDVPDTPPAAESQPTGTAQDDFPALQLSTGVASRAAPARGAPETAGASSASDLPSLSLAPAAGSSDMKHTTPDHVPSALERAMMQTAARAEAEAEEEKKEEKKQSAAEVSAAKTAPHIVTFKHAPESEDGAADTPEPTLEDEPVNERLNVDRTAHDVLAESAEARRRAEAAQQARAAAAARRQRMEEEARRAAKAERASNRKGAGRAVALALIGLPLVAIAFLQLVPLNGYIPEAQQAISERLNQPTTISKLHYVLLPTPRLVLEGVRVGSAQDVRIDRVDAYAWPTTIMAAPKVFDQVDATGVTIDQAMLAAIPSWTGGRSATSVHVSRLKLKDVKLSIPDSGLEGISGDVTFERNGTIKQAVLGNDKLKVELTPQQTGLRLVLNAQDWRAPFGPPVPFTFLTIDGIADKQHFGTTALSGRLGGGALTGSLAARWDTALIVGGEFKLQGAKVDELVAKAAPDLKMRGTVAAAGRYALQSDSASGVLGKPLVEATFSITRGELSSIDLARAIQSSGSLRGGGRTAFDELTGTLQVNGRRYNYQQLHLSSGPLDARGNVDVTAGGPISGRVDAAFDARGTTARASFRITGTVKEPQIVR